MFFSYSRTDETNTIDLSIILPTGKRIHDTKEKKEKIREIKKWISEETDFPADRLILKCGKRTCSNSKYLRYYVTKDVDDWTLRAEIKPFIITVPTGKESITIPGNSFDSVLKIRKTIEEKLNLSCNFSLYFSGTLLEDKETLYFHDIFDDIELELHCSLNVQIKTQKNDISLCVSIFDSVKSMKCCIHKEHCIPSDVQRLYLDNTLLEDSEVLVDYQISASSNLSLQCSPVSVEFKTPDDEALTLKVSVYDSITTLKKHVESETGVPHDLLELQLNEQQLEDSKLLLDYNISERINVKLRCATMNVQVRTALDKFVTLSVASFDFVKKLKQPQKAVDDIPESEQILSSNDHELRGDERLSDHRILADSWLQLHRTGEFYVLVQTSFYELILIHTEPSSSVARLQTDIEERTGVPSVKQLFTFDGEALKSTQILADVGIASGSLLRLDFAEALLNVCTSFAPKRKLQIAVETHASVLKVKTEIEAMEGVPVREQSLRLAGERLQDDRALVEYGIQDGSAVELCFEIRVKSLAGKECYIDADPAEAISSVKKRIETFFCIPHDEQQLEFREELPDEATLSACGVKGNSCLILITSASEQDLEASRGIFEVFVKLFSGEVVSVEGNSDQSVGDFREGLVGSRDELQHVRADHLLLVSDGELPSDELSLAAVETSLERPLQVLARPASFFLIVWVPWWRHAFVVESGPIEKVFDVKRRLARSTGVSEDRQLLVFRQRLLQDDAFLCDAGLRCGTLLQLQRRTDTEFYLRAIPGEARVGPRAEPGAVLRSTPLTGDLLVKDFAMGCSCVLHVMAAQPGSMRVFVAAMNGRAVLLDVAPEDCIDGLKTRLQKLDAQADTQILLFRGRPLDNRATISSSGIHHEALLTLDHRILSCRARDDQGEACVQLGGPPGALGLLPPPGQPPMELQLEAQALCCPLVPALAHQNLPLDAEAEDEAVGVKRTIDNDCVIPPKRQKLDTSLDVGIRAHDSLPFEDDAAELQFYVKINLSRMKAIEASPSLTIADLKTQLSQTEDVSPTAVSIMQNSKELQDCKSLTEAAIQQGSVVSVFICHSAVPVRVESTCGWAGLVKVALNRSVRSLTGAIEQESGIPAATQRLFLNGRQIEQRQSLLRLGVGQEATIFVDRKDCDKIWLFFRDAQGLLKNVVVNPDDSVTSVKQAICARLDVDQDTICVMKEDVLLS